ncbi:MAG TPA: LacI family DNA-binding transcriptional regulator [Anaerolineales bacterium]|nr:LacI family DNA-binding transcriptional regulator [Anaerolineales bacterium]
MKRQNRHPATIHDVAALAEVSIATVSRVINGTTPVSDRISARVREAITSLEFVPHSAARVLATKKTNTIGLILPEISGFYFSPLLRGVEECLRGKGYDLLVQSTVAESESTASPTLKLGAHNTDGLLVFAASLSDLEITRLHSYGFPMVLLHQSPPEGLDVPCVTIDNKTGTIKIINHLLEVHGYRKIAFLVGPESEEDSYWRELGYREALSSHGIPYDPILIAAGHFDTSVAQVSVSGLLKKGVVFDAIFTGDDDSAIGAITAIQNAGLRVPEDIAVVGFDDVYISQYLSPPLTTVHAPIEQAGYAAAQQLIRLIHQENVEPLVLLPTEIIIRRSCGCPGS